MKTNIQKIALLSLFGLLATSVPVVAQTLESSDPLNPMLMEDDSATVLSGAVIAKSDGVIVVQGKSILITDETTFTTRDGTILKYEDLHAGDYVKVTTALSENSQVQAVSVEVIKSKD